MAKSKTAKSEESTKPIRSRYKGGEKVTATVDGRKFQGEVLRADTKLHTVPIVVIKTQEGQEIEADERYTHTLLPPQIYRVRVRVPRHTIVKMEMEEGGDLTLDLDCSSSYYLGFVHPLDVFAMSDQGETVTAKGVYVNQEGEISVSKVE